MIIREIQCKHRQTKDLARHCHALQRRFIPAGNQNVAPYTDQSELLLCEKIDMVNPDKWIQTLRPYPLTLICFVAYLRWLAQRDDVVTDDNDLILALERNSCDRLALLEQDLRDSRDVLGMSDERFRDAFFSNDLLTDDPEKVHDVLTEPALVRDLAGNGFADITKLPPFLKDGQQRCAAADFTATRSAKKYAIELKVVRPENNPKPQPGVPADNASIPYWWGTMFRNNVLTKIEAKNCKVLTQLSNTVRLLSCDSTVLAVYIHRMGPSTLMDREDYERELVEIRKRYSQIDHVFMKDYSGRIVVCPSFDAQQTHAEAPSRRTLRVTS